MIGLLRSRTASWFWSPAGWFRPERATRMVCQVCGKNPATFHCTEIHHNKMTEIHVCDDCAEERGYQVAPKKGKFDISNLLAGMADSMTSNEEERVGHVQCPRCGLVYSAFK